MFQFLKNLFSSRKNAAAPRPRLELEVLEERCCPTTTNLDIFTGTLHITGDASKNDVWIHDDGTGKLLVNYDVQFGGQKYTHTEVYFSPMIQTIKVDLKGGDDKFTYGIFENDFIFAKKLDVNMGAGSDFASLYVSAPPAQPRPHIQANLSAKFVMGQDSENEHDDVQIRLGVVDSVDVNIEAWLGGGDDNFTAYLRGGLSGDAKLRFGVMGGKGNDTQKVFAGHPDSDAIDPLAPTTPYKISKNAVLDVFLNGGAGDDYLGLYYGGELDGKLRHDFEHGSGNKTSVLWIDKLPGSTGQVEPYKPGL